ncbi:hypothetical protein FGO68_gene13107 [Halteria grandinella]|uniref:Thymidine kinase n=1 Tax=Halteria grandinella TaxID=5974 RepID=A0A8J8NKY4_HALGN|nr:hypothetical protein FGO68_gene13107 [Halteria grandinella]
MQSTPNIESSPSTTSHSSGGAAGSPPDSTSAKPRHIPAHHVLPKLKGHIELIIGPMFAGKSTELLRRMKRHEVAGNRCLRIKFAADNRYSVDSIATHDKQTMHAIGATKMSDIGNLYQDFDVIAVDEGQFFPDIVEWTDRAANDGKLVIISALDGTFLRTGFDTILQLIPKAEKVKKLQAICRNCNQNASFTFRTDSSQALQVIGGEDMYKPLCRECFNEENISKELRAAEAQDETTELKTRGKEVDAEMTQATASVQ